MSDLIERDALLATLRERLAAAAAGGTVALVAGEAGVGKTSVLRALARERAATAPVWWGACDALETPHPLAPLLDIAREQRPRFAAALGGPRPALFEAVLDELRLAAAPVLVVIEDAHWADDATLDLLKFLGRRIERTHALLAVSYRDDEVGAGHPLRRLIGELPPERRIAIDVPRLTAAGVEALAARLGVRADGVHAATRGNAFFATEMLRDTSSPRAAVPRTVQDVVLARCAGLPAEVQAVLKLAAIVPGRIERWLVERLLAPDVATVEAALASGLLVAEGASLSYRHELGRVAVEQSLSPPLAQDLHARVLAALAAADASTPPARLVHHAVAAQDRAAITRAAPLAAAEAAARGAHREAAAQWLIALEQGTPSAAERERWLEQAAVECAMVGRLDDAMAARHTLERVARERGDLAAAAIQLSRRAMLHVGRMEHDEADALSRQALALVEALPQGVAHATVWRGEGYLRMLTRDCAASVAWSQRAAELAGALGDTALAAEAASGRAVSLLFLDYAAGCRELEALAAAHFAAGRLLNGTIALGNLGSGSGELMQLANAERALREALAIAVAHEFDSTAYYVRSWLALTCLLRGRWNEAAAWADAVVGHDGVAPMSRLMALLALARLRTRRGDPGAEAALEQGHALTGEHNTLQRIAPLRAARAEHAMALADPARAAAEAAAALPLAQAKQHPWFVGELAYWCWRAGTLETPPAPCAAPYALEIAGRWREAADAWQALDCPYERARALALGDAAAQQEALSVFEALGARPAADEVRRRLRDAGVRGVARGARPSTRANPAGLTASEMQVLALMCQDLRNAEIAQRLHRSVRTVDHHVAAVLAKLGVTSRVAAVRRAEREGWVAAAAGAPHRK